MRKLFLTILICAFAALPAAADSWMTVYGPEGGIVGQVIATEADKQANGTDFIYTIPGFAIDGDQFSNYTTLYPSNPAVISDVFGIAFTNDDYFLSFSADFAGNPDPFYYADLVSSDNQNFLNAGQPFEATQYLSQSLQDQGYTAFYQSTAGSPVPEPGSLILLGSGIAGISIFLRRKR